MHRILIAIAGPIAVAVVVSYGLLHLAEADRQAQAKPPVWIGSAR